MKKKIMTPFMNFKVLCTQQKLLHALLRKQLLLLKQEKINLRKNKSQHF